MDGSTGWPELIKTGTTTRGDWDKSNEQGKTKMMEATNECALVWQHDIEQCVSPLPLC
jgi:hypothetical protein